jgi:Fe-Mn family superoxide dismutase
MIGKLRSIATAQVSRRFMGTGKFSLPDLPYGYGELEPVISGQIMQLHHSKHHATYVTNLNAATAKLEESLAKNDVTGVVAAQQAIRFNGGGHINHTIFWKNLAPPKKGGGEPPTGDLKTLIDGQYGSLDSLVSAMSTATVAVQGSGWGWLGYDKVNKKLSIVATSNQDPLEATTGLVPLLGIDVWEHAYYLDYKNVRADYVKNIWKIVNWQDVAERLKAAK